MVPTPARWLAVTLVLSGCSEPAVRRPQTREVTRATLFGDPQLVPTREGERVRRELATAAEIRETLAGALPWAVDHVQVRLTAGEVPGRVSVILQTTEAASYQPDAEVVSQIRRLVAGIVPESDWRPEQTSVVVGAAPSKQDQEDTRGARVFFLALSLIGLGASGGVVIDRTLVRQRIRKMPR